MMRGRRRQHLLLADEKLISFVGQDDAEAFTPLYDRHSHAAFFARFLLPHPHLEDLNNGQHHPKRRPEKVHFERYRQLRAASSWPSRGGQPSKEEAHPSL